MTVSKWTGRITTIIAIVVICLIAPVAYGFKTLMDQQSKTKQVTHQLKDTTHQLKQVQAELVTGLKANTKARVTTIGQRCQLTKLILHVLSSRHDLKDAVAFQNSLDACLVQKAAVDKLAKSGP